MKKLIVCLGISALALASSVQAGDKAACTDKSSACCSGCSPSKSACKTSSKKVVMSPKAAGAVGLDKPLKVVG